MRPLWERERIIYLPYHPAIEAALDPVVLVAATIKVAGRLEDGLP
jgi:hypothetical protein